MRDGHESIVSPSVLCDRATEAKSTRAQRIGSTITIDAAMTYISVVKVHTGQRGLTDTLPVTGGGLIALMSASCLGDR